MKKKVIKFKKKNDIPRLDFQTNLFLSVVKAKKVSHPAVREVENKLYMQPYSCDKHEVYVFNNFEEYKNFYLMYFDSIDDELIDMAVITHGNKGQVVALRSLVNLIIVKKQTFDFYNSFTEEKCDEIHENGYLTPFDVLAYWDSTKACPPASTGIIDKRRCDFFNNCEDCKMEYATHHIQYEVPKEEYVKLIKVKRNKNNEIVW